MMKNYYFILKALFVLKISEFKCWKTALYKKLLDQKDKINFKI